MTHIDNCDIIYYKIIEQRFNKMCVNLQNISKNLYFDIYLITQVLTLSLFFAYLKYIYCICFIFYREDQNKEFLNIAIDEKTFSYSTNDIWHNNNTFDVIDVLILGIIKLQNDHTKNMKYSTLIIALKYNSSNSSICTII